MIATNRRKSKTGPRTLSVCAATIATACHSCGLLIPGPEFPSQERLAASFSRLPVRVIVTSETEPVWNATLRDRGEVSLEGNLPELSLTARQWELLLAGTFLVPLFSARYTRTYDPEHPDRMIITDDGGWVCEVRWVEGQSLPCGVRLADPDGTWSSRGTSLVRVSHHEPGDYRFSIRDDTSEWNGRVSVRVIPAE